MLEPQNLQISSCQLIDDNYTAIMTLQGRLQAYTEIYLEVSGAQNPMSTSMNKGISVSSLNANDVTLETASNLSILHLKPAVLSGFTAIPESPVLGMTTALLV